VTNRTDKVNSLNSGCANFAYNISGVDYHLIKCTLLPSVRSIKVCSLEKFDDSKVFSLFHQRATNRGLLVCEFICVNSTIDCDDIAYHLLQSAATVCFSMLLPLYLAYPMVGYGASAQFLTQLLPDEKTMNTGF
jgi:hypothetical protein